MSSKLFSNNFQLKNAKTSKKSKDISDMYIKSPEKFINLAINNNYSFDSNTYKVDKSKIFQDKFKKPNKNEFISISEFPEIDEDNNYNNINYISIIQSSVFENENKNPEKIKVVNANNYLNNENNSISCFNDCKQQLLKKHYEERTSFIFNRPNACFASNSIVENEKNYQIKRYRYLKDYQYLFNPVIRRKNAKIIQKWWKSRISPKIEKRKKIIKIQSIYRGYMTRKNLNDIICISVIYQNFINKLKSVLGNYVHRKYFPKRYYKKKYALEKIFPLKLKLFFRKWKRNNSNEVEKEKAAKFILKNRENKRYILIILKTFFQIWKSKCELFQKNEDKIISLNKQKEKFSKLVKLVYIVEKIGKRNAYHLTKENLFNYLKYLLRNEYLEKVVKIYKKYESRKYLKKYLDIWKRLRYKEKEQNLKMQILKNEIKTQIRKKDEEFLRNNLNILRTKTNLQNINDLKRAKKQFLFPEGARHITTCIRKNIVRLIFKEYIKKTNAGKKLLKIIRKVFAKHYLNKWKNINNKLSQKEKCKLHLKKLIKKFGHLSNNINLSKYFNRWKNIFYMNKYKKQKIDGYIKFCNSLEKYILNKNKKVKKYKNIFLRQKLNKYVNIGGDAIKQKLNKCVNFVDKNNKISKEKKYFNKWQKYVEYSKLNDLKAKNLETVSRLTKVLYDSKKLAKNLYEWKGKKNLINLANEYKRKDKIKNGISCLDKIKKQRMILFFKSLRDAKYNLMKKIILKILSKKYIKKILLIYFNRYKINVLKLQNRYKLSNLSKLNKLKNVLNSRIKKQEKNNFGILKKCISKWYLISKIINKENYNQFLINIKKAISLINSNLTKKCLKAPFTSIKNTEINIKNKILQKLKKYFYDNDKKVLRNAFHKFLKNIQYKSKTIIKTQMIYNIKFKNEQINHKTILSKYFNKWKLLNKIYVKQRNNNSVLITNSIASIIKRKNQKIFINNIKRIKYRYYMRNFAKKIYGLYTISKYRNLFKFLKKWKNNVAKLNSIEIQKEKGYKIIYNTLAKAFSYKKIEESLIPLLINKYKKRYFKEFITKFNQLYLAKIHCNYRAFLKNENIARKYNFKFKKTIRPNNPENRKKVKIIDESPKKEEIIKNEIPKPRLSRYKIPKIFSNLRKVNNLNSKDIEVTNTSVLIRRDKFYKERIIPYLINYLNELRIKRLRSVINCFKYIKKNNMFCTLLKLWTKKQNHLDKINLIKSIKKSRVKQQLFKLIRKKIIHVLVTKYLSQIKRRNDLLILIQHIYYYKKINKLKRAIRFLRIWKIYVKLIRNKASTLEKFEKHFSETYEKLTDSIFQDNDKEKSVQTQVFYFLDKVNEYDGKRKMKNCGNIQNSLNNCPSGESIDKNDIISNSISNFNKEKLSINKSNVMLSRFYNYNKQKDDKLSNSMIKDNGKKIVSTLFSKTKKNK